MEYYSLFHQAQLFNFNDAAGGFWKARVAPWNRQVYI